MPDFIRANSAKIAFIIALALALGFVAVDSHWRISQVRAASALAQPKIDSPQNLDAPERHTILPPASMDARWWIIFAEQMKREGEWRLRTSEFDNAPAGREIHWSSAPLWILIGLSQLVDTSPGSVQIAALYFGPITFCLFLIPLSLLVFRAFGGFPAAAFSLASAGFFPFFQFFRGGETDHHGLVAACALAMVLFLLIAHRQQPISLSVKKARRGKSDSTPTTGAKNHAARWVIASGLAGAVGLWISAASLIPALVGCGLSALAIALFLPKESFPPRFWTLWGAAGGAGSLFFYLLEYFPHHLGWRMEVNNPLYAIAWVGAGFMLEALTRALSKRGALIPSKKDALFLSISLLAIVAPAIVIIFWKDSTFWVSDRFLYDLHRYYIREFQGLGAYLTGDGAARFALTYILPSALTLLVAVRLYFSRYISNSQRSVILLAVGPALVLQILSFSQMRWAGNACALWIALIVALTEILATASFPKWWRIPAGALFLLVISFYPMQSIATAREIASSPQAVDKKFLPPLVTHDIALRINRSTPDKTPVILSGPTSSTEMAYYGGGKTLGTLYWENKPGLEAAANIYAATDEATFKSLLEKHGITHLVIFSWDSFAQSYVRLWRGLGRDAEARDACLAGYLEGRRPQPLWLRPLYYAIPPSFDLKKAWVRIYQFVPAQTPSQWHYHVGLYQMEAGRRDLAEKSFQESLKLDEGNVEARTALDATRR